MDDRAIYIINDGLDDIAFRIYDKVLYDLTDQERLDLIGEILKSLASAIKKEF